MSASADSSSKKKQPKTAAAKKELTWVEQIAKVRGARLLSRSAAAAAKAPADAQAAKKK